MKKWVYVAGILLVAGAATAVYLTQRPAEQPSAANLPTRTVQASKGNMETKVSGSGSVSVSEVNNVKAGYKGTISKINFKVGDQVKKGQTLVVFKKTDNSERIKQTELSLKKQQLQMQQFQKQYKEAPEENRESIQVNMESLDLEIEQNESTLASLQAEEAENHDVVAPAAGTIKESQIETGNDVNENTVVAVIADYTKLEFIMSADELDIPSIQSGQSAQVTLNAFPNQQFTGKITSIGKEGNSNNGVATYEVGISLTKPDGVLAGMSGQAEIVTQTKNDVVLVPVEAVIAMGNKHYVRVPGEAGSASSAANDGKEPISGQGNADDVNKQDRKADNPQNTGNGNAAGGWSRANRSDSGTPSGELTSRNGETGQENTRNNGRMDMRQAMGGTLKEVVVGISNDTYAEITSGLQAGDAVLIATPQGKAGSGSSTTEQRQRQNGMGFGGGGFPGGASFQGGSMGSRGGRQ
ncbi:efflux RND transporter periplasmic adaptor subunit [Paenibacillus sp. NAIST15-1]|uniref:efflux RND transporter periplasmic adaptor subunit n=1 Tax=Paenibacillus sp. NAIST15-1 TaxID=1605994 RepID=UPI00086F29DA|nr:efflux RND transporter periplasmic adaptor subunit [Paenibacillus sp. NAIST15-1]GAV12683.1 efflux transporter, RND family, MFP subunit [Paenibacillus sp. NAIST15-1]